MKKRMMKLLVKLVIVDFVLTIIANLIACIYMNGCIRDVENLMYDRATKTLSDVNMGNTIAPPGLEAEEKENELHFYVNVFAVSAPFIATKYGIYESETGKLICESDDEQFLIESDRRNSTDGSGIRYFCKVKNKSEVNALLASYKTQSESYGMVVNEISRKDLDCYITNMTVYDVVDSEEKEETFTYEVNEPGYETVTASDDLHLMDALGSSGDLLGYSEKVKNRFQSLSERNLAHYDRVKAHMSFADYSEEGTENQYFYFAPNSDSIQYSARTIYGADGKEYRLFSCFTFNVREITLRYVIGFYIVTFLLAAVVFAIREKLLLTKERAKKQSEEYRKNLMDAMAHDLKSPLTVISGYAESLKENVNEDKREYYAQAILDNVEKMNRGIENTLILSELEQVKKIKCEDEISLAKLSDEIFSSFENVMMKRNISYCIDGDMLLTCNVELMRKLISNLVLNAVKYAKDNSRISVSMTEKQYEIRNQMQKELKCDPKELISPFVRGDKERSGASGNGLGLSIANNIAACHGMTLHIEVKDGYFSVLIKKR